MKYKNFKQALLFKVGSVKNKKRCIAEQSAMHLFFVYDMAIPII